MHQPAHLPWSARIQRLVCAMQPLPTPVAPQLNRLPGVRMVLFDVYGTLLISGSGDIGVAQPVDSEGAFHAAVQAVGLTTKASLDGRLQERVLHYHAAARSSGVDVPEVDIRRIWRELVADLLIEVPDEQQLGALAIEYEGRVNPVCAMPGFPEVLQALPSKLVTGVVSNAQFYTPLIMEVLARQTLTQLGFRPDRCAWSYQCGVAKPSPRLLQSVLTQTGVPPDQVVVVGNDLLKDVAPARALGCRTVLFAGDLRSLRANPVELRDPSARPDAIITELRQLPGLL